MPVSAVRKRRIIRSDPTPNRGVPHAPARLRGEEARDGELHPATCHQKFTETRLWHSRNWTPCSDTSEKARLAMPKATKRTKAAPPAAPRPSAKLPAATDPGKSAKGKPTAQQAPKPTEKAEELRFKVTPAFKQNFKQTAKELGLKKGVLLEKLLADWHSRPPTPAERALTTSRKAITATPARRATGRS